MYLMVKCRSSATSASEAWTSFPIVRRKYPKAQWNATSKTIRKCRDDRLMFSAMYMYRCANMTREKCRKGELLFSQVVDSNGKTRTIICPASERETLQILMNNIEVPPANHEDGADYWHHLNFFRELKHSICTSPDGWHVYFYAYTKYYWNPCCK